MNYATFLVVSLLWPMTAIGGEFKIREYHTYGPKNYLELQSEKKDGQKIASILNLIVLSHLDFYIRILAPVEVDDTEEEIMKYYRENIPDEFKKALNSKKINSSLADKFSDAFKETKLFKEVDTLVKKAGYVVSKIGFEKFSMMRGKIFVAEITLQCKKERSP